MNKNRKIAYVLILLGAVILFVGAAMHLAGGYPLVARTLAASNLELGFKKALQSVFLMIGVCWIALTALALIATFHRISRSKLIVVFCGASLLVQIPIWVAMMGWFIGNEMFLAGGGLILIGGLLLPRQLHAADRG